MRVEKQTKPIKVCPKNKISLQKKNTTKTDTSLRTATHRATLPKTKQQHKQSSTPWLSHSCLLSSIIAFNVKIYIVITTDSCCRCWYYWFLIELSHIQIHIHLLNPLSIPIVIVVTAAVAIGVVACANCALCAISRSPFSKQLLLLCYCYCYCYIH